MEQHPWPILLWGLAAIGAVLAGCSEGGKAPEPSPTPAASLSGLPAFAVPPAEWKTIRDSDLGLSLEFPYDLRVTKTPPGLPDPSIQMDGNSPSQDLYLTLKAQDLGTVQLDLAQDMDRTVQHLRSMTQILRGLQIQSHSTNMAGAEGFMAEGTAHLPNGAPLEVKVIKLRKGRVLLDVLIQHAATPQGRSSAERILNSLSF